MLKHGVKKLQPKSDFWKNWQNYNKPQFDPEPDPNLDCLQALATDLLVTKHMQFWDFKTSYGHSHGQQVPMLLRRSNEQTQNSQKEKLSQVSHPYQV